MNHQSEEVSSESSQKKAAAIMIMIRTGSWAIVTMNIEKGGPNASNVHPTNSMSVMIEDWHCASMFCVLLHLDLDIFGYLQREYRLNLLYLCTKLLFN